MSKHIAIFTILIIGLMCFGCNESIEIEANNEESNSIDVDSVIRLPESQLMVDDSLKKYNYKGKGIRNF